MARWLSGRQGTGGARHGGRQGQAGVTSGRSGADKPEEC